MARWPIHPDDWRRFVDDHVEQAHAAATLAAGTVGVLALGAGGLLALLTADVVSLAAGVGVAATSAVTGGAVVAATGAQRRRRHAEPGDVVLGEREVTIGWQRHRFDRDGARLESCAYEDGPVPTVDVVYTLPARRGRQATWLRIPVGPGAEAEAAAWVERHRAGLPESLSAHRHDRSPARGAAPGAVADSDEADAA